jgi:hypothetical protein
MVVNSRIALRVSRLNYQKKIFFQIQLMKKGEKPPHKFKVHRVATKLMATIFWDAAGILLVDYLPRGRTMNGQYYVDLIIQMRQAIIEKRSSKVSR